MAGDLGRASGITISHGVPPLSARVPFVVNGAATARMILWFSQGFQIFDQVVLFGG
jgi:hypothetical protein